MSAVCATCANLIVPEGARQTWWRWLCAAAKREPVYNPLTGKMDGAEPYQRCAKINDGQCPDYEAGPTVLNPRPMPVEAA